MDQEVWYEIEVSHRDDLNDWNRYGQQSYDSLESAQKVIDRFSGNSDQWKYQIVKVTATRASAEAVGADHGRLRRDGAGGGADGMSHPLQSWVDEAVAQAMQSPCVSKRGVVISSEDGRLISAAYNNQPYPFVCTGDERCKSKCGKTAVHAEQAAILRAREPLAGAWMLHAKAKQGKPCASMAPSCLECSKLILASGIAWMHLLHDPQAQMLPGATVEAEVEGFQSTGELGILQVRRYSAVHFHYLTAEWWHRIELKLASSEVSA